MKHTRDHVLKKAQDFRRNDATRGKANRGHKPPRPIEGFISSNATLRYWWMLEEEVREIVRESFYDALEMDSLRLHARCIYSHLIRIREGSDLHDRARENLERGNIESLVVHPDECPTCIKQRLGLSSMHINAA